MPENPQSASVLFKATDQNFILFAGEESFQKFKSVALQRIRLLHFHVMNLLLVWHRMASFHSATLSNIHKPFLVKLLIQKNKCFPKSTEQQTLHSSI